MPLTLLVFIFLFLFFAGKNYAIAEKSWKKSESSSAVQVPSAQEGVAHFGQQRLETSLEHSSSPSLTRPWTPSQDCRSHDDAQEAGMEMCRLQKAHQGKRHVLSGLWTILGRLCGQCVPGDGCIVIYALTDPFQAYELLQLYSRERLLGRMAQPQGIECESQEQAAKAQISKDTTGRRQRKRRQRQRQRETSRNSLPYREWGKREWHLYHHHQCHRHLDPRNHGCSLQRPIMPLEDRPKRHL